MRCALTLTCCTSLVVSSHESLKRNCQSSQRFICHQYFWFPVVSHSRFGRFPGSRLGVFLGSKNIWPDSTLVGKKKSTKRFSPPPTIRRQNKYPEEHHTSKHLGRAKKKRESKNIPKGSLIFVFLPMFFNVLFFSFFSNTCFCCIFIARFVFAHVFLSLILHFFVFCIWFFVFVFCIFLHFFVLHVFCCFFAFSFSLIFVF